MAQCIGKKNQLPLLTEGWSWILVLIAGLLNLSEDETRSDTNMAAALHSCSVSWLLEDKAANCILVFLMILNLHFQHKNKCTLQKISIDC